LGDLDSLTSLLLRFLPILIAGKSRPEVEVIECWDLPVTLLAVDERDKVEPILFYNDFTRKITNRIDEKEVGSADNGIFVK
jgi:hypothetical protein